MPFWRFFHPPGLWTAAEKQQLARTITEDIYYTLPPFWVDVAFFEVSAENMYVGGEQPSKQFVRINIDHIARHLSDDDKRREDFKVRMENAIRPFLADRGVSYEWSVAETPRDLWRVDGLDPPPQMSEPFFKWWKMGKPVPWDKETVQTIR